MKKIIFFFFSAVITIILSCCKDSDEENMNTVLYRVFANDTNASLIIDGWGSNGYIIVKNGWTYKEQTDSRWAQICVRCKDRNVLIRVEIFKNGRLLETKEGNSYVLLDLKIKD